MQIRFIRSIRVLFSVLGVEYSSMIEGLKALARAGDPGCGLLFRVSGFGFQEKAPRKARKKEETQRAPRKKGNGKLELHLNDDIKVKSVQISFIRSICVLFISRGLLHTDKTD